jgi:anti-sigma factor ChrR (cupin superfamily)
LCAGEVASESLLSDEERSSLSLEVDEEAVRFAMDWRLEGARSEEEAMASRQDAWVRLRSKVVDW